MMTLPWDGHLMVEMIYPMKNLVSVGIEAVNSPSNIYARRGSHPPKGAIAHCSDKTRQRLVEGHVPLSGSYGP
jgi:hypothetical protein